MSSRLRTIAGGPVRVGPGRVRERHRGGQQAVNVGVERSGMLVHLQRIHGWTRSEAAVLASLAVDLRITQIVNGTVGVHAVLPPGSYTKV